jgi:hypothetical protein
MIIISLGNISGPAIKIQKPSIPAAKGVVYDFVVGSRGEIFRVSYPG